MDVIEAIKRRRSINFFEVSLRQGITLLPRAFRRKISEFVRFENYS